MRMLRRLRGTLLIAATWGAAFAGVGAVFGLGLVLGIASGVLPPSPNGWEGVYFYVLIVISRVVRWAAMGALSGIVFAGTIMVAERRQTLASLSARRFARWGLLAGALGAAAMAAPAVVALLSHDGAHAGLVWLLAIEFASMPVVGGALARATAAATLRAARRDAHASLGEHAGVGVLPVTDRATQTAPSRGISPDRVPNIVDALAGKAAGVNIRGERI